MKKLVLAMAVSALGACSSMPQMPAMPKLALPGLPGASSAAGASTLGAAPALASHDATAREHTAHAIDLLDAGKVADARLSLTAALSKSPKDTTALRLLEQIDSDPVTLLGSNSEPYTVVAGDTMSGLASRFLDSPLLFFALSRYNGLEAPRSLSVGRTLKIPVRPGRTLASAIPAIPSAPAQTLAGRPADVSKANAVRLQALELLNSGDAARAVSLLTEAQAMDETSLAIRKDLERARRIQSALADG